jgi:ISXO2-like transposase domain
LDAQGYKHEFVTHSKGEYVRGEVHTNNLENFWSLLKRGVIGTYHHVSKKYLPLYLAEFQFRFNNRENPDHLWRSHTRLLRHSNWRMLQSKQEHASESRELHLKCSRSSPAAQQYQQRENKATKPTNHHYEREDDKE